MKFEVLALSYEAIEALRPLVEIIRHSDRDLAKQIHLRQHPRSSGADARALR